VDIYVSAKLINTFAISEQAYWPFDIHGYHLHGPLRGSRSRM